MKYLLPPIFALLIASSGMAESVALYGFATEDDSLYQYLISREHYNRLPVIDIGAVDLPITPGEATRIAKRAIADDLSPAQLAELRCGHINIVEIPDPDTKVSNTKRWYYNIQFKSESGKLFMSPSFLYNQVLVLMDGSAIRAKKNDG